jgi:hypothetical protein
MFLPFCFAFLFGCRWVTCKARNTPMLRHSYPERDYTFGQVMPKLRTSISLTQAGLAELRSASGRQASPIPKLNTSNTFLGSVCEPPPLRPSRRKRRSAPCGKRRSNGCSSRRVGSQPTVRQSLDEERHVHVWEKVYLMGSGFSRKVCPSAHDSWPFLRCEGQTCSLRRAFTISEGWYHLRTEEDCRKPLVFSSFQDSFKHINLLTSPKA